jgi:hypothetical protein
VFRRESKTEPKRFKRYPYGALRFRLISAAGVALIGFILVVTHVPGAEALPGGLFQFLLGLGLISLASVAFFLSRWMAKRGI